MHIPNEQVREYMDRAGGPLVMLPSTPGADTPAGLCMDGSKVSFGEIGIQVYPPPRDPRTACQAQRRYCEVLLNRTQEEAAKLDAALSGRGPLYRLPGRNDWFYAHICNIGNWGGPPAKGEDLMDRFTEIIRRESERIADLNREIERLAPARTY
jgi:hypothetical protein